MQETMVILDEGNLPHTRCTRCNIFVPWVALNIIHTSISLCPRGAEQKWHQIAAERTKSIVESAFWYYGQTLINVTFSKCPSRLLMELYDDWSAVVANLCKL